MTKDLLIKSSAIIVAGGILTSLYGAGILFFTEEKISSTKTTVIGALAILGGVALMNYSIKNNK